MTSLRHFFRRHRLLAGYVVALALLMTALVPAGYMTSVNNGSLTIELCSGYGPTRMVASPAMAHHHHKSGMPDKEMPCAFAGHAAPSLSTVDPFLLAIAVAFIVAIITSLAQAHPCFRFDYLRPPLRGPPFPT